MELKKAYSMEMGKQDESDEFSLSSTAIDGNNSGSNVESIGCFNRFFKLKCLLALLLGISVFISAVFWLAPFSDRGDLDLDPRYRGHTVVASFKLLKPESLLKDSVDQLEAELAEVFGDDFSKVTILSVEGSGINTTGIVFAVDPLAKHSISSVQLSLIRSSFVSLVIRESNLHFQSQALFGDPSFFEVLKFPGGITVSPPQTAYPLQKVQILFNFTLNNSILQVQENFEVLRNQLSTGLHLTNNENLYMRLTNCRGSTVDPPCTVQTSVVLRVGVPSQPRLKQLAQTIKDSPARNLGLNNTVFGKVKQVSLSSVLQHSLNSDASLTPTPTPTPAPAPSPLPNHHHHHHHHHHHGASPRSSMPSFSPVEAPQPIKGVPAPSPSPVKQQHAVPSLAPGQSYQSRPPIAHPPINRYHAKPPGCRFRFRSRYFPSSPQESPAAPSMAPQHSFAATPNIPAKPPHPVAYMIPPSSRLPNVIYACVHPPSASQMDPHKLPSIAPFPSVGRHLTAPHWVFSLLVALVIILSFR